MGASPADAFADAMVGLVISIAAGSLVACAIAVALSPLSPLGPIRSVYHPGIAFDWTVLGGGLLWLMGGLVLGAAVLALRAAPHRLARRARLAPARPSRVAQAAAALGLPLPGVVGLQFALEPGAGRTTVPARWVLAGAVIAVTLVTATLTFSSSLNALVTHPKLYGWNWDYALQSENDVPPQALAALDARPRRRGVVGVRRSRPSIRWSNRPSVDSAGRSANGGPPDPRRPRLRPGQTTGGAGRRHACAPPHPHRCLGDHQLWVAEHRAALSSPDASQSRWHGHLPRYRRLQHLCRAHLDGHRSAPS